MENRAKIMVVDDNKVNLDLCKSILKELYSVYTTTSAEGMFELLEQVIPDMILLDVRMPNIDGYEACKMLKAIPKYANIPVIFVTALNDVEAEMEGWDLGAIDYVIKPYFPPILIKRISAHVALISQTKYTQSILDAKSDFLSDISHELRTPLNAVIGLTDIALKDNSVCEDTHELLEEVSKAGKQLLHLINDLLDITKLDANTFKLYISKYNLHDVINSAVSQSKLYIDDKDIKLKVDISNNIPTELEGDHTRVTQILHNLLSNAFKYTEQGWVWLNISSIDCDCGIIKLVIQVKDTGCGIDEKYISSIFERHVVANNEVSSERYKAHTTGIGLYITKSIVDIMGGTIEVTSKLGEGSTFTVIIPQAI